MLIKDTTRGFSVRTASRRLWFTGQEPRFEGFSGGNLSLVLLSSSGDSNEMTCEFLICHGQEQL